MAGNILIFALAALAVYRAARMLADEEGPFSLFARLRGAVDPDQRTWVGRGLNCPLCIGLWLALPVALALSTDWLLWWFGLAGAAAWLHRQER
jgi:hypothetical protein